MLHDNTVQRYVQFLISLELSAYTEEWRMGLQHADKQGLDVGIIAVITAEQGRAWTASHVELEDVMCTDDKLEDMTITCTIEHDDNVASCQIRTFKQDSLQKISVVIVPRDAGLDTVKLNISLSQDRSDPCRKVPAMSPSPTPILSDMVPGTPSTTRLINWVENQINGPVYPDIPDESLGQQGDVHSEERSVTEPDTQAPEARFSSEEVFAFLVQLRESGKMPAPFSTPKKRKL
ncbi:hypothetical protein NEOLEDRAFT_1174573 [Neolentinus lepideus HHB14362 ss-1]|uniref:Uncharacterized protein n=1 Tax=Neolentinus lepideus HHB14362 ss-1 TaxID=1314782 RepID=A0A165VVW4_9AGAM|nr:hypothetical protein NEOLEDRAFT_1174573 [Neolentinus lepideus HHB14362 ss-1]